MRQKIGEAATKIEEYTNGSFEWCIDREIWFSTFSLKPYLGAALQVPRPSLRPWVSDRKKAKLRVFFWSIMWKYKSRNLLENNQRQKHTEMENGLKGWDKSRNKPFFWIYMSVLMKWINKRIAEIIAVYFSGRIGLSNLKEVDVWSKWYRNNCKL